MNSVYSKNGAKYAKQAVREENKLADLVWRRLERIKNKRMRVMKLGTVIRNGGYR